ncbi:MAG: hypothetical protein Q8P69_00170 [bacterium]|nr:hypothetical protein [bacterium]
MEKQTAGLDKRKLHEVIEVQIHIAREMIKDNSNVPSAVVCLTTLFRSLQESKFPAEAAKRIAREQKELPGIIFHRGFSYEVEVIQEALADLANRPAEEENVATTLGQVPCLDDFEITDQRSLVSRSFEGRWKKARLNGEIGGLGLVTAKYGGINCTGEFMPDFELDWKVNWFKRRG